MRPKELPPVELLRELFSYNPDTGELRWKKDQQIAGTPSNKYTRVQVNHLKYPAHRICWAIHFGEDPYPNEIDHRDKNSHNNSINNLRVVTRAVNNQNRVMPLPTTGVKGISEKWCKGHRYFVVRQGRKYIGQCKTMEDAVQMLQSVTTP